MNCMLGAVRKHSTAAVTGFTSFPAEQFAGVEYYYLYLQSSTAAGIVIDVMAYKSLMGKRFD